LEIFRGTRGQGKSVNVAVAAYVTTEGRLKLYELGKTVLYCDTDSVSYNQNLGDLTDEMEFGSGSYIEEFVSGGPQN